MPNETKAELEAMWCRCEQEKKQPCEHCPREVNGKMEYCSWAMGQITKAALAAAFNR